MKRPYSKAFKSIPADDIRNDIPQEQLALIGAVALSYNYAENTINRMLYWAIGMPISMHRDIVSRINGVDGKIAIIKSGATEIGIPENIRVFLAETLGEGGFGLLKKYRDAVIHARILNNKIGIGELIESKGRHMEVLLSQAALDGLFNHLEAIRLELAALMLMMFEAFSLKNDASADDPKKSSYEEDIQNYFAQAQSYRTRRLSLPPIPEFPDEAELRALENPAAPAMPEQLLGILNLGSLGLAAIGRTDGKNPPPNEG